MNDPAPPDAAATPVDLPKLAERVYRLFVTELRLERARCAPRGGLRD